MGFSSTASLAGACAWAANEVTAAHPLKRAPNLNRPIPPFLINAPNGTFIGVEDSGGKYMGSGKLVPISLQLAVLAGVNFWMKCN
jgi:hypothetical protein